MALHGKQAPSRGGLSTLGDGALGPHRPRYHWERYRSKDGQPYWRLVSDMPRLPDAYLDSVVYLYPSAGHAENGVREGGTGFLVRTRLGVPIGEGWPWEIYIVTNRHIVDNGHLCVRVNKLRGGWHLIETKLDDWLPHPHGHDVALTPILLAEEEWRYIAIPDTSFLTRALASELDIGPGDDAFLVSRFLAHEGRHENRPMLHAGTVSQTPKEGEGVLNQYTQLHEPSFVVETHSRPGYSGSPVYGYIHPSQPPMGVERDLTPRTFLLGVAWGYIPTHERLSDVEGEKLPATVTLSSGLAAVAPAWHIQDVLEEEKFVAQREELDDMLRKQSPEPPAPGEGAAPMGDGSNGE